MTTSPPGLTTPANLNIPPGEHTADLRKHQLGGKLPGGWEFTLQSASEGVGRALAWLVVVGVAIVSGYAVERLAVNLAMRSAPAVILVLSMGAIVLIGGGYYVEFAAPRRVLKLSIALITLLCLTMGAGYLLDRHTNLFRDAFTSGDEHRREPTIFGDFYTVQPGDTLSGIAGRWGDTGGYEDLVNKNPGTQPSGTDLARNPNLIHPGDVLKNSGAGARR